MTSLSVVPPGCTGPASGFPRGRVLGLWLAQQRQARNWTIPDMRRHLRDAAARAGDTLPAGDDLSLLIRRWERGTQEMSEKYRQHYSQALAIPLTDLGTAPLPVTGPAGPWTTTSEPSWHACGARTPSSPTTATP